MTVQSAPVIGGGDYTYRFVHDWAKLPPGWSFKDVPAVAVDSSDRVYVFSRGEHPVIVFDRDGNFIHSWGEGTFGRPHGLHMGPDDTLYCTDDGNHVVRKCTLDGKVLLELGVPGGSPAFSGMPFSQCTHTALAPNGDIYVSDGYKNARVHKYAPDGKLLFSWGESGVEPGEFNIPHNICCDRDGWVYVADRENHRIQVFDGNGKFETQWHNYHRPLALYLDERRDWRMYVGEAAAHTGTSKMHPNLGARIKVISNKHGEVVARIGDGVQSPEPGKIFSVHGLAVDSRGDIYVAEVSYGTWPQLFPNLPIPPNLRSVFKLERISA